MNVTALLGTTHDDEDEAVADLVGHCLGITPSDRWRLETVDYHSGSPATACLHRLRGTDTQGRSWSLFCKELQHVRHWPTLAQMPPQMAQSFAEQFPWRAELALWDDRVQACLPPEMRSPQLHRVVDLPEDRAAVWMEDITEHPTSWNLTPAALPAPPANAVTADEDVTIPASIDVDVDVERFARAAHLLGRWNARATCGDVLAVSDLPPGYALRMYAERSVPLRGLTPLADEALWTHPWLAPHAALRGRLRAASERIPELLDRLDTHRQALPHGDASPQNLLVPLADPATFVAIDVSFTSPHALGFDLGQLLVGLVHAGRMPAAALPQVAAVIVPAYLTGLAREGLEVSEADVRWAFAASTLLRSGLDAVPYHLLTSTNGGSGAGAADADTNDGPAAAHVRALLEQRLALSQFLLDQFTDVDRTLTVHRSTTGKAS